MFIGQYGSCCELDTIQLLRFNRRPETDQEKRPHAHRVGGCIWESGVLQSSPERMFTLCSQCDPVTERGDVILGQIHSEPVQTNGTRNKRLFCRYQEIQPDSK